MKYKLTLAILSAIGTAIILLSTRHYGAGISPDSVTYIATARHIATGIGAVTYDGTPLVLHPPLYPTLLATIAYVFRLDPLSSAHIVNAVLFGSIVYFSGLLFLRHLKSYVCAFLGTASVLVTYPLILVSLMAWSEPLFILLTLLYLLLLESYLERRNITLLLLLSLSVALACLTRYIGIILLFTGMVSVLLFRQDNSRIKYGHLFLFLFISALPIGVWVIRNYFLSGTLFGPRGPSYYSLSQNLAFVFNTFLHRYIPDRLSEHRSILMLLSATIGFLAGLSVRGNWSKFRTVLLEIGPLLLFIVAYVGFLVISSTTTAYDKIGDRLLSPVFVPMNLLLLFFASKILASLVRQGLSQRLANILLAIFVVIWLVNATRDTTSLITDAMSQGLEYSGKYWRNSQTIKYFLQNRKSEHGCKIFYSNAPDVLYILANLVAKMSPRKMLGAKIINDISNLKGSWPEESNACLVWFDKVDRNYLFTVDELRTVANVQQVIRLEDGAVYLVTRK